MLVITDNKFTEYTASKHENNNRPILRKKQILTALEQSKFKITTIKPFLDWKTISELKVHRQDYLDFLSSAYESGKAALNKDNDNEFINSYGGLAPIVFSNAGKTTEDQLKKMEPYRKMGYYCTDFTTPIHSDTTEKILASCSTVYQATKELLTNKLVYALTLFPGHHAGHAFFGGYCYINNIAVAAKLLESQTKEKIVILDLDYHAGDGTHDIFLDNQQISTISINMDPNYDYPYYRGFEGAYGKYNNQHYITIEPKAPAAKYFEKLQAALKLIDSITPKYLLIAFGGDTYKDDPEVAPCAGMGLDLTDYTEIGKLISATVKKHGSHILITQEGGYNMTHIGTIVRNFLDGLEQIYLI